MLRAAVVDWRELDGLYRQWLLEEDVFARDADLAEQIARFREVRCEAVETMAWCVRDDAGRPVAMTHLLVHDGFAMVEDVYCDPAFRRRGFGAACVRAAVEEAHGRGCSPIFLPTDLDGPAPRFYEALGFTRGEILTRVLTRPAT